MPPALSPWRARGDRTQIIRLKPDPVSRKDSHLSAGPEAPALHRSCSPHHTLAYTLRQSHGADSPDPEAVEQKKGGPEGPPFFLLACRFQLAACNCCRSDGADAPSLHRWLPFRAAREPPLLPRLDAVGTHGAFRLDEVLHLALELEVVVARLRDRRRRRRLVGRDRHVPVEVEARPGRD